MSDDADARNPSNRFPSCTTTLCVAKKTSKKIPTPIEYTKL